MKDTKQNSLTLYIINRPIVKKLCTTTLTTINWLDELKKGGFSNGKLRKEWEEEGIITDWAQTFANEPTYCMSYMKNKHSLSTCWEG